MRTYDNIPVWGAPQENAIAQMQAAQAYGIDKCALMADHHLGYSIPVGGVIAFEKHVCPNGVGFDIACGNKAVRLDCDAQTVRENIHQYMNEIQQRISFGIGRKNKERVDHPLFDEPIWNEIDWLKPLKEKASDQLGTVGSGNHYVDVFIDELDRVWIGVHFGSRGLGHTICTYFIDAAGGADGINSKPVILEEDSDLGSQYIECMELAGRYAYAGRDWVCSRVAQILNGNIVEEVHNHHNFAWREMHDGKNYWVIRKGATPAFPGQRGFVEGSMGDISVILEGVESKESQEALYSTIHGSGRLLGRTQAKGKVHRKTGKRIREGLVKKEDMLEWVNRKGVELRGADVDESPHCYKRIEEVLEAHKNTVKILHTLQPIGVCMAGANDFDPYKD